MRLLIVLSVLCLWQANAQFLDARLRSFPFSRLFQQDAPAKQNERQQLVVSAADPQTGKPQVLMMQNTATLPGVIDTVGSSAKELVGGPVREVSNAVNGLLKLLGSTTKGTLALAGGTVEQLLRMLNAGGGVLVGTLKPQDTYVMVTGSPSTNGQFATAKPTENVNADLLNNLVGLIQQQGKNLNDPQKNRLSDTQEQKENDA